VADRDEWPVVRVGAVVGIRPESVGLYRELHANPWQEVRDEIRRAGISNYSIFHMREMNLLFSYYEYRGNDRAADAQRMALNPAMQEWWKLCRPCQVPLAPTHGQRRWIDVDPIFFQE
jgi:L-rhamnose mutarotase